MSINISKYRTGVTCRAVLISVILTPLNAYWVFSMESVYDFAKPTLFSLFFNVIFILLVLIALNVPLRRLSPNWSLSQGELLTVYIMLSQASALVGHSMIQILVPTIAAPYGLATPENEWAELFWRYLPDWLVVRNDAALDGYIRRTKVESTLYTARHIQAWLAPVIIWSVFICVLMSVMMCINLLIRKQWIHREKLAYPIIQLPYEMTEPASGLFRNKLMWIGFILAGGQHLINGLHFFFSDIPSLNTRPYTLKIFLAGLSGFF